MTKTRHGRSTLALALFASVTMCHGFTAPVTPRLVGQPAVAARAAACMQKREPDVYDEASAQMRLNLPLLAGGAFLYFGAPLLIGEEGMAALRAGPLGGILNALSQPLLSRQDVVDSAGIPYDTSLAPTSGLALLVGYNVLRRVIIPRVQKRLAASKEEGSPPPTD